MQQDADDGADGGECDGVEELPATADLVEEQVRTDPEAGARADGDDHGDDRAADLLLDERPVDQPEDDDESSGKLQVLLVGAARSGAGTITVIGRGRWIRRAFVGTCAFKRFHAVTPSARSSP